MKAMILAAGFGTRMLPHSERIPKPLFPILDKTLLDLTIENVREAGPELIVVNAHHLAGQVERHVKEQDYGVEVVVSIEDKILGTAGGIKRAERWLAGGDFLVMNCDIIMDVDWEALTNAHKARGGAATLALRENPAPERYSVIRIGDDGRITSFAGARGEDDDQSRKDFMFTGVSMLSEEIFEQIPTGRKVDIAKEVYTPMTKRGEGLYGHIVSSPWTDVGTLEDYYKAVMEALGSSDVTPAVMWGELHGISIQPPVFIETGAVIEPGARLGPYAAVHKNAHVGGGAILRECVALPGARAEKGGLYEKKVI